MHPVYINGSLGWLHRPSRMDASFGVVLCPALGREARWTYRAMRQLADRLAAAGLPALRFEYPGTGDSADVPPWEQPLAAWRDSVHAAADWLRAQTGLQRVAFAGLRFGALLAADVAASRDDVAAIALLGPVVSGRGYVRELRLAAIGGEGDAAPEQGIELDGTALPEATLLDIGKIDLNRATQAPAPSMLLLDESERGGTYAGRMLALGADVQRAPFPGYDRLMRVATSNQVPHAALDSVVTWFGSLPDTFIPGSQTFGRTLPVAALLRQADCNETPLIFGPERRLAGVLCEPAGPSAGGRAVLIVNTGGDPRGGIGRFSVALARSLAACGVASLRFDFAGLGDSRLPGDDDSHLYETSRAADIAAALDQLEHYGYRRLGGIGLCTGAYHLLHAAVQQWRLDTMVLINLVTFAWRPGDVLEVAQRALGHSNGHYKELAWKFRTWRRVLNGGVDLRHVAKTLCSRLVSRVTRGGANLLAAAGVQTSLNKPRRILQSMLGRGVHVLMVFGFDDPGVAPLEANFGRKGRALAAMRGAEVRIERGIDHTLSRGVMQTRVIQIIEDFLAEAF